MNTGRQTNYMLALKVIVRCAIVTLAAASPSLHALDPSLDITQYVHTAWTANYGLRGTIRSIVQTPDGYLWLGTEFGLVRFDGVRFVPWSPLPGQHLPGRHLPNLNIMSLLATRDGTLWIGTIDGLASWKNDELVQYAEFAGGPVMSLLEDHEGTVWVGASGKLCRIRSGKAECATIDGNPGLGRYDLYGNRAQTVMSLYEDRDGRLWAGTESSLWQWKPGPPQRYLSQPISTQQGLVQGDHANELTVISGNNFVVRQVIHNKPYDYALPGVRPFKPWRLLRDSNGALWIGTLDQGLLRVHQGKTKRFSLNNGLSGNLVTALFEDREGNIWAGTVNGLDRFREPVVNTISGHQGLATPAWSVLTSRDGSVWIGSLDGLQRWNQGQMTIYRSTPRPPMPEGRDIELITDPGLPDNEVHSLFEDQRGRIWVTTFRGVAWFENGRFSRVSGVPAGTANAITADQHKGVWISYAKDGLFHVVEGRTVESVPWPWSKGEDKRVSAIVPDPVNGGMWLGFLDGGLGYLKDGQIDRTLTTKDGLGADRVWNLRIDRDGKLWAATQGGLSRIKDNQIATLTTKNGLPCDAVSWVMEDDTASLWLYTACGLLRLDRTELEAWESDSKRIIHSTLFDGSDGVRMHALLTGYSPVVARARDGKLWFVHADGVSFIDPHNLRVNKVPPPVHVEQVTADGKTYATANGLRLPPRIRDLTIDYAALSLVAPEKVRFRYKLEGQDSDWREVVNDREVQYSNLLPKHYRFRVIACNNSGVWSEEDATLDFVIPPAWYQTNWFRALCAALFVAFIWEAYRLRVRQLRLQDKKLRDVIETIPAFAWTAQPDGLIDFANRNWIEYSGLSTDQTVGSGWQVTVHEADLKRHTDRWHASIERGAPYEDEVRFRRADGHYRWFLVRGVPLRDARGKIVKWYGTSTDIEDRKCAEEAARNSEAYLAVAQRLTHTGSWAMDGKSRELLYWSEEMFRMYGFDPLQGLPRLDQARQRIHPDDRDKVKKRDDKTFFERADGEVEFRIIMPDGTVKHIHALAHAVVGANGDLVEVVGTNVDITDRKRAEQLQADLAHTNRVSMLGELAASLAHELKQPIAATVTNANTSLRWLRHEQPNLDEVRQAAERIVKDGHRAGDIIDRLRSLYKKTPLQRGVVDVNEIIREMVVLLRGEANRFAISIRTDLAADLPKITADRVQVQQVLMNLMLNGIEAMNDKGGLLTIKSGPQDGHVVISVSDTGVGLPADMANRMFDAFFTTKPQGTGMGLAISRSIIESHGGRLWATPNDGHGASFYFSLPTTTEALQTADAEG